MWETSVPERPPAAMANPSQPSALNPSVFAIGDKDRAACVGENGQDVDRDEFLRRHSPDSRLEANQKSQRIERLFRAIDQVIGGALGMLPAERREDHVAKPGEGLPPAVPVTTQPKSLRMERGYGKLDLRSLAGVSSSLQGQSSSSGIARAF